MKTNEKLEVVYEIFKDLSVKKNNGCIVPDVVFEVIKESVERFLEDEFAEEYTGLDDEMPDAFNSWVGELVDGDDVLSSIID